MSVERMRVEINVLEQADGDEVFYGYLMGLSMEERSDGLVRVIAKFVYNDVVNYQYIPNSLVPLCRDALLSNLAEVTDNGQWPHGKYWIHRISESTWTMEIP